MSDNWKRHQDMRTPLKRALGLGSAKTGTDHFMWQRITAIVLVLLGAFLGEAVQ